MTDEQWRPPAKRGQAWQEEEEYDFCSVESQWGGGSDEPSGPAWSKDWTTSGGRATFTQPSDYGPMSGFEGLAGSDPGSEKPGWPVVKKKTRTRTPGRAKAIGKNIVVFSLVAAAIIFFSNNDIMAWLDWSNDPEPSNWAYESTGLLAAQESGLTGNGVIVCQVDTGVELSHPVFTGLNSIGWVDFIKGRAKPYDDNGHGTSMASLIAGQGDWLGAAPGADYIFIKAIGKSGEASDDIVGKAVKACVDNEADIIALSLGGGDLNFISDASAQEVRDAMLQGVFVVAAAGNDGEDDDGQAASPSSVPRAFSVGAVDKNNVIAPFSSIGRENQGHPNLKPEFVAPGVNLTAAAPGGGYVITSGTSAAVPLVAGGLALYLEAHPEYQREGSEGGDGDTIDVVKRQFIESAKKIGPLKPKAYSHDVYYGYGLINIAALLAANADPNATSG